MQDQLYSYIKTTSVKRWEFFSEDELRCKGTEIISGYRHMAYNDVLGKNRDSPHLLGKAVDIACHGKKAYNIIRIGMAHGFTGIGVKQHGEKEDRFVHLDTMSNGERHRPMFWSYKS